MSSNKMLVFLFTGTIAAIYAIVTVILFPPAQGVQLSLSMPESVSTTHASSQIAGMFTVTDFSKLLSHENILALIIFSMLVGTVMGAIPSGGMLGELLIISVYGFPPSVLIAIAAISILIDPLATMLNVTGNSVSAMMIARLTEGKKWM